ncbi:MAG: TolC family protein [Armatimonadota bacterium]
MSECVSAALEHAYSLRAKREAAGEADASAEAAKAPLRPQFGLAPSVSRVRPEFGPVKIELPGMGEGTFGDSRVDSVGFAITVQQILWSGGGLEGARKQAQLAAKVAAIQEDAELIDTTFRVKQAYFAALHADANVHVAERNLEAAQAQLDAARARLVEGVVAQGDVFRAEAFYANAQQQQIAARRAAQTARLKLDLAIGVPGFTQGKRLAEPEETPQAPPDALEPLIARAQKQRPDVRAADHNVRIARQGVRIAKAGRMPSVALAGQWATRDTDSTILVDDTYQVALSVNYALYDGGGSRAQIDAARKHLHQAQIQAEFVRQQVLTDVTDALLAVQEADALYEAAQRGVASADENLRVVRLQYEAGMANSVDVADAIAARAQADLNRAAALYNRWIARAALDRALGEPAALPPRP